MLFSMEYLSTSCTSYKTSRTMEQGSFVGQSAESTSVLCSRISIGYPLTLELKNENLLTTFKALTGVGPGYVCDMLHPNQPPRALRSMNLALLRRRSETRKTVGEKSFAAAAPKLWNKFPLSLRQAPEVEGFKSALKTHLFKKAYSV